MADDQTELQHRLTERFGTLESHIPMSNPTLLSMASRGSCRHFTEETVNSNIIDMICAVALASPTKSDLQQRDIVIVNEPELRSSIDSLFSADSWIKNAPNILVFCANNRRQRQLGEWHDKPFPNDHLDAFFNASVDAGIALSAFVTAAEATGLGCCPISEIRNHCDAISELLRLPPHVFPVAGLAVGWPAQSPKVSMRLPLSVTVHHNRFAETNVKAHIDDYDQRRSTKQPYAEQRNTQRYGQVPDYGWSEDKARQYAQAQRTDFGQFIRTKGFSLD